MSETREKLLNTAMRMFAERGYDASSVADILRDSGTNSGSLYYFFPTKQDLLIAVLERYRLGIVPMLLEPAWRGIEDPIDKVFALLGRYRGLLEGSECLYGCPIGSLALEIHEPDPPVRDMLAKNFDGWVRHVETCLEEAGDRLPRRLNRTGLARFVLTTMEGGVMQSRTHRTLDAFDDSIASLKDYFDHLIKEAEEEKI